MPSASVAPSASPSAGAPKARTYRATGEIGDVRFAPDGRIVLVERDWAANVSRVVALDPYGNVLPGWPWTQGDTGDPIAMAELGPEGSVYVAVRGAQGDPQTYTWTLHRLDAEARELAGFPVALPDVPFCGMAVGPDGTAYLNCEREDATTTAGVTSVRAVRPDGSTANGWPVVLQGGGTIDGFRPDGALVITTVGERGWQIAVIRPDGTSAPGWPRGTPVGSTWRSTAAAGSTSPATTGPRASAAPRPAPPTPCCGATGPRFAGWPVTLRGWASEPLVADDGSMTILTMNGRAIRYGRSGKVVDGWPVTGVGVSVGCYSGSVPVSAGKDGIVVVGDGQATRLTNGGRIARGWPVDLPYRPAITCPSCTPGPAGPLAPAIGERGIYVAGTAATDRGSWCSRGTGRCPRPARRPSARPATTSSGCGSRPTGGSGCCSRAGRTRANRSLGCWSRSPRTGRSRTDGARSPGIRVAVWGSRPGGQRRRRKRARTCSTAARAMSAVDHTGIVRATGSGRKMSDTPPRRAPWRSARGVSGHTPSLARKTAASPATSTAATTVDRSRRPAIPVRSSQAIAAELDEEDRGMGSADQRPG